MLPPQPVVSCSKDSNVEDLDKLYYPVVEEPVCKSWILDDCLVLAVLESGVSGQMTQASSGHWRSAAMGVKKTVGRPSVSTMERDDSADIASTAWCPAHLRRSGGLNWRKPLLVSPPCPTAHPGTAGHLLGVV